MAPAVATLIEESSQFDSVALDRTLAVYETDDPPASCTTWMASDDDASAPRMRKVPVVGLSIRTPISGTT